MKHKLFTILSIVFSIVIFGVIYESSSTKKNESDAVIEEQNAENEEGPESPSDRWEYELNMLKDPVTGKIPSHIREKEMEIAKQIQRKEDLTWNTDNLNTYTPFGPDNVGGRTRAVVYDFYDPTKILAGGVSSGIFKSVNGAPWENVTPNNEIHNVTAIAQDIRNNPTNSTKKTWYYATGERTSAIGNSAGANGAYYQGNGIYKSIDEGNTWNILQSTRAGKKLEDFDSPFDAVTRLAVHPDNGYVFAACNGVIMRSKDGGASWHPVLGEEDLNGVFPTDVVISRSGRIYASFHGKTPRTTINGLPSNNVLTEGVWRANNSEGDSAAIEIDPDTGNPVYVNWKKIAGSEIIGVFGGIPFPPIPENDTTGKKGWKSHQSQGYGRIVLATCVDLISAKEYLYVLYDNFHVENCLPNSTPYPEADFFIRRDANIPIFDLTEANWIENTKYLPNSAGLCDPGNNPFAVQKGYDLAIAVKPGDSTLILIGGTNAYRNDGSLITPNFVRIGGYESSLSSRSYKDHHPDIHYFSFKPDDLKTVLSGTDGGVHKTDDIKANPKVVWSVLNDKYKTSQYYYVALDPVVNSKNAIGGLQDQGISLTANGNVIHTLIDSADGCSVGISKPVGGNVYYYLSRQKGNLLRLKSTDPPNTDTKIKIKPNGITTDGLFVTLFLLDPDNTEILYYANNNKLYRTISASTVVPANWDEMTGIATKVGDDSITALAVSRGIYTDADSASRKLYIGTQDNGRIFLFKNPKYRDKADQPIDIKGNISTSGTIISIAVDPKDDKKVMAVFSNYNVESIWYTDNATANPVVWKSVEGNIALPSIRSCAIVDRGPNMTEYYVGTSVGLYSTTTLEGPATKWVREGSDIIKYAVSSSIAYRPEDNGLLIGTHGNGMYYTTIAKDSLCQDFSSVTFPPDSWAVDFTVTNYWSRRTQSGYGAGTGSARFRFYAAPSGTIQSLVTRTCGPTVNGDYILFDYAYAPYTSGVDSLVIEASKNNGTTYSDTVAHLYGKDGGGSLNTAPTMTSEFAPNGLQWYTKGFSLPVGTNKIRFRAKSGNGNNLFIDNACIKNHPASLSFSIKLIIQGYYNLSTLKLNKKDTVSLLIRKASAPYTLVDSTKGLLNDSSFTVTGNFSNIPTGQYYIVVKHKNSIETWNIAGGENIEQGVTYTYDFTNAVTKAYGSNMTLINSAKFAIYNGDINQDGLIDLSDIVLVFNDVINFATGNAVTDVTGDDIVDLSDLIITFNNAQNFVSVNSPLSFDSNKKNKMENINDEIKIFPPKIILDDN